MTKGARVFIVIDKPTKIIEAKLSAKGFPLSGFCNGSQKGNQ